ncbi:retrovirus-related pol polyprotein from transposon TNT 1-94 [Tanacetum coccineum]|uniref:Retrovirus-related pol polyprotein from transposon TNT 1-94 n=1 Tax=Tanacetum coccineum TaxID=301880 RepID=A0ABQ5CAP6_9ASTR
MSQEVLLTVMNSMSLNNDFVNMKMQKCDSCEKCLHLDVELSKSKQAYHDLLKNHSQLEKHCISLKVSMQLKQEVFQNDKSCVNNNAVEIQEYFEINDLKAQLQDKFKTICKLKDTIRYLSKNAKEEKVNQDKCEFEPKNKELENSVAKLLSKNERLCNEINHVKQLNLKSMENKDLKAQIQDKVFVITSLKNDLRKLKGKEIVENVVHTPSVTTIAPGMFKLDLELLPPRLLQNREVHIAYLRNTQEQANILREIVEQAKAKKPLDSELDLACKYIIRIQELLVYVQDTCPNAIPPSAKKVTVKPMNNVKKVRFVEPLTSSSKIQQVESSNTSDSNTPVLSSTGVKCSTSNCGSKPPGNKKNDRISQTPSRNKKNKVEAQSRKVNKVNHVVKPICDVDVKHSLSKANSKILCATCNKSMFDGVHDKFLLDLVQNGNKRTKSPKKHKKQNIWKPTGHVFTDVGFKWKPTGRIFTIVGNSCPLTRITSTNVVQIVLWYLDSSCSKHMAGNCSQLMNFVSKFLDLEVSFRKKTCFIRNLEGVDLLSGLRDTNLYTISLDDTLKSSLICLISKASKTKSWLWHRRLSHLNFGTLNKLAKDGLARGIPGLKFQKDHLFFKTKDEAPAIIIKCIKIIQARLKATVRNVRTDNGTGFVNQTLREWYENVGISHQTSAARTPQQNGVVERYNKTPYELMQDKKPDLSFFHIFGSLCYPTNDHDDLGKFDAKADIEIFVGYAPAKKAFRIYNRRTRIITETIHVTFNELTAMASEQFSSGPGLNYMTPATSSTGLGSNPVSQQPCLPLIRDDWDWLFQLMFDEYFNPSQIIVSPVQEAAAPRAKVFEESPKTPTFHDDPLNEYPNEDSTSHGSSSNVRQLLTLFEHNDRCTKDHPIAKVIGDPSRSVSTRKKLKTDAMWCYFDSFLTSVDLKNFKQAMTEPSWIDAMQEEIHEFERLKVWELVSCPDKVFLIKLKWIYKVKTDEFGGVLKKKARLVAQGFRQ